MADPLSIIASVISIATVAVHSSKALSKLIDNVQGAPGAIKAVASDVYAFQSIVSSLRIALEDSEIKDAISGDIVLVDIIGSLLKPLRNCEEALQNLTSKLQSGLAYSEGSTLRATALNLKWGLSAKNEVKYVQSRLETTKSTLNTALETITMYVLLFLITTGAYAEETKAM